MLHLSRYYNLTIGSGSGELKVPALLPLIKQQLKRNKMYNTRIVEGTIDYTRVLTDRINENSKRPDPAFAKKMKDAGYPITTVVFVCNVTEEVFNSL